MPRPARYDAEDILDQARDLVINQGPGSLTMTAVAEALAAPSGSIYHRFAGRDILAATMWIRALRRFQSGYLSELGRDDPLAAALGAAGHVARWSRENLDDACVLLLFRSRDLLRRGWPDALREENIELRDRLERGIGSLGAALGAATRDDMHRVRFAVVDIPYAAVRPALMTGEPPPAIAEDLIVETVTRTLQPFVRDN